MGHPRITENFSSIPCTLARHITIYYTCLFRAVAYRISKIAQPKCNIEPNIFCLFERASKTAGAVRPLFLNLASILVQKKDTCPLFSYFQAVFWDIDLSMNFFRISSDIIKKRALIAPLVFYALSNKKKISIFQWAFTEKSCRGKVLFFTLVWWISSFRHMI
jgi:hypothetical protein